MKLALVKGSTSQTVLIFIQDSTSTTGAGKTGLVFNTASLVAYYARPRAAAVAITLATQTVTGAFSSGGFVEIDATNMPGLYRLDIPDAALATGVDSVAVMLKGATGMAPLPLEVQLTSVDLNNATTGGLANLDAAVTTRLAPTVAGRTLDVTTTGEAGIDWANIGSPTTAQNLSGTSTKAVEPTVAGRTLDVSATGEAGIDWANIGSPTTAQNLSATNIDVDQVVASVSGSVNVGQWNGTAVPAENTAGYPIVTIKDGTGIGELDTASGVVIARDHTGAALATAAALATVQADTDDIQTRLPAALVGGRMDANMGAVSADAVAADNLEAMLDGTGGVTLTTAITGSVTGNLSGSVGSVTAAVTVGTNNDKTGYALSATGSVAFTESYAADGAAATLPQLLYTLLALESEKSISGTTLTAKKLDGVTTAATFTLNSATAPTSITRAT